jgi:hypothetical protein
MKRRKGVSDSRVNQTAVDLFKLARRMLGQGFTTDSREFIEVSIGLHRALALRPWQIDVLDLRRSRIRPMPAFVSSRSFIAGSWRWQEAKALYS